MKKLYFLIIPFFIFFHSCNNTKQLKIQESKSVFAKEPNDSAKYIHLKYNLYTTKYGEIFERKLAEARNQACNCEFEVYYDNIFAFFNEDSVITKHLKEIIDIDSFAEIDCTEYSKDKNHVYYFHSNSDGGIRSIVENADPKTFKRLYNYFWGIDKNNVFYKDEMLIGLNINKMQLLYPNDSTDFFVDYVKDDKNVFYQSEKIENADAKTFKLIAETNYDAQDKNHKYYCGQQWDKK